MERAEKIIKEYEKGAGFRVCTLCDKLILRGKRVMLVREYEKSDGFIGQKVIGAVCIKCYNKILKRNLGGSQ